jgi:integrase/recombinase XerD
MALKSVPDPLLITTSPHSSPKPPIIELREARVEEFLLARSLAPNSQKAYRRDLTYFLRWISIGWAAVTPRQVAQFKAHLFRLDPETNKRVLADSSVCRISIVGW